MQNIEVDLLCNGLVDENTPPSAIGNTQILSLQSLRPDLPSWENPVQAWIQTGEFQEEL
jgi:hypothetical protein